MRQKSIVGLWLMAIALVTLTPSAAGATSLLLPPGSIWEYTSVDPTTGGPGWMTTSGGWQTGLAPFGNDTSPVGNWPGRQTDWAANTHLWVRTTFDASSIDLNSVAWALGVDNGFDLFLNGAHVAGGNAEGYTFQWEYGGAFASGLLNGGTNYIAVALEDHGGLTAFDMQVTGNAVPEPASLLLLGSGTLLIARRLRRRPSQNA